MNVMERNLTDTIAQVAKERAVEVVKKSINNNGLKVYEFESKKYLLESDVNKRLDVSRDMISDALFTLLKGNIDINLAKSKITKIHNPDRTVSFAKESIIQYANSLFDSAEKTAAPNAVKNPKSFR